MAEGIPPGDVEAVVYDLDGTLVHLVVDWATVAEELRSVYADAGVAADGWGVWECYDRADAHGLTDAVNAVLLEHELAGADRSDRLPAADALSELTVPIGVCSLNAEATCRRALEHHSLDSYVDAVVGRDSVGTVKPDPEPLLATLRALGADPTEAIFIGNRQRDEETARRAGVRFAYVGGDGPTE